MSSQSVYLSGLPIKCTMLCKLSVGKLHVVKNHEWRRNALFANVLIQI